MAIPFRIKDDEQDKAREIVPEKVSETIPSPALWGESGNEQVEESESFVGRLLHELVGVYLRLCSSGRSSSNGVRTRRSRNENGKLIHFCFCKIIRSMSLLGKLRRVHKHLLD